MLAKRIIPCLDVNNGRVVKGIHFVNLRDAGDPVECGLRYSAEGADELVFLDITASSDRRKIVAEMVRGVADAINIPFTVGGGLRNADDIQEILSSVAEAVRIPVIASGGAGSLEHLYRGLTEAGASAVLAASIFHFREVTIAQAKSYLRERGVVIR